MVSKKLIVWHKMTEQATFVYFFRMSGGRRAHENIFFTRDNIFCRAIVISVRLLGPKTYFALRAKSILGTIRNGLIGLSLNYSVW